MEVLPSSTVLSDSQFNPLEGTITTFSFVGLPVYRQETFQEDPPSPLDLHELFQTDYEQDPPPTSLELY